MTKNVMRSGSYHHRHRAGDDVELRHGLQFGHDLLFWKKLESIQFTAK